MNRVPLSFEDTITLSRAVSELGVPLHRLRSWHRRGRIQPVGRLRGNVVNGGCYVFLRADIEALIADPPLRGRPPQQGGAA